MEAIADRAVERMTSHVEEVVTEPAAAPLLDLDALPDVEETEHDEVRGRTRV